MYDSKVIAKNVIDDVIAEADIALSIPVTTYLRWLNELEQNLYGAIVRGQKRETVTGANGEIPVTCDPADIISIYHEGDALAKTTSELLSLMANSNFYAINGTKVESLYGDVEYDVYCIERPEIKTEQNYSTETVKLPVEFLELAYSKLRGEGYKLANEDGLAAKWLNDYNALLSDFVIWHGQRKGYGD